MYTIREGSVRVNGESVGTFSRMVREGWVEVLAEAGASLCAGRGRSSGRTYVSLFCDAPSVFFGPVRDKCGRTVGVEIAGCGEDALNGLIASLEFALMALRDTRAGVGDGG